MAIVKPRSEGILISGRFDRRSANFKTELKAFEERLRQLQKELGFKQFVDAVREDGPIIEIDIIPLALTRGGAKAETKAPAGSGFERAEGSSFTTASSPSETIARLSQKAAAPAAGSIRAGALAFAFPAPRPKMPGRPAVRDADG